MKKIYFSLVLLCLSFLSLSVSAQTSTTFSYTGSVATYTVTGSTLGIQAIGAQGGNSSYFSGGHGVNEYGVFTVPTGHVLSIMVGQQPASAGNVGGGGGGSFVWDNASTTLPLIAAGGGGGAGYSGTSNGADGVTTTTGTQGPGGGGGAGASGSGGTAPSASYYAAGGCGWSSNGAVAYISGVSCSLAQGGATPLTGGAGGAFGGTSGSDGPGGYGGGGGGQGQCGATGGGGGGGYSGGGGGVYTSSFYGGGGGGSYNGGSSIVTSTGTATGNGVVIITVLCGATGTIVGSNNLCFGGTTTLSNPTGASGGTWSSSASSTVATINSTSGLVTAIGAGTTTITYTVANPCGALATMTLTVNPAVSITGTLNACTGGVTRTLTPSPTGGTFSGGTSGTATVNSSTGVVTTGITAGTVNITYTLPSGCSTTTPFTVNAAPAAITGSTTVCAGSTTSLFDATGGGTWSSSSSSATVGSTGIVTGVSAGTPTIVYTSAAGCTAATGVVVNALSPITGSLGICLGATSSLGDIVAGGTWTSTNTAVGTVNSTSGVVTGLSAGTTTIVYTLPSGCAASASFGVSSTTPGVFTVSGGGAVCAGGTGVTINLSGSTNFVSYQLINGSTLQGSPVIGAGSAFSFPATNIGGTYSVVANYGTGCATTMTGTATVTANPLPTQYTVTAANGGLYCVGGTGVHLGMSNSQTGVSYSLLNSSLTSVSTVSGTGSTLDFGLITTTGAYTVLATNTASGCTNAMTNSVTVSTNPLPVNTYSVTGTGGFCSGGTGLPIGLSASDNGVSYQLYLSGSPVLSPVLSTGGAISFGTVTTGGTYSVVATNATTGCTSTLAGTAVITVNSLPTIYAVTGGGAYCAGGTGVTVGLAGSTIGVNYQLFNGTSLVTTTLGVTTPGTGSALNFGLMTATGAYTVVATNGATGCGLTMSGSAAVSTTPLPTAYSVTGGGNYCAGGVGMHVGLSGSTTGTNYQLFIGTLLVGGASGTGGALDFGLQLTAGTYTIVATNSVTGCTNTMSGSVTIGINPLPAQFALSPAGGTYCTGTTGVTVGLTGSVSGTTYQLFSGSALSGGTVSGSGTGISFGAKTAGSYTATATTAAGCTIAMLGSTAVVANPLPTVYNVTGGGGYCAGGTGAHVGLAATDLGISYQLYNGAAVGTGVPGTGTIIDFGLQTATGTYTVVATNTSTTCATGMNGGLMVSINPLPTAYTVSVTGTGAYCAGSAAPHVLLSSSIAGNNYQLFKAGATVGTPIAGNGFSLDFGAQAVAGTYTVVATNTTTGCTNNMLGTAVITINPLPTVYNVTVTSGGNYCSGGTGVHIGLNSSVTGATYQLYNGLATVGAPLTGTGLALDFGTDTARGTFTVVATSAAGCSVTMSGSAVVTVLPVPASFSMTGGGNYCSGGTGVTVGLAGSVTGINYQLTLASAPVGAPTPGVGTSLNFGLQTTPGTYSVIATNATTGCTSTMTGVEVVGINVLPALHTISASGSYCPGTAGLHVSIDGSNSGISYQLVQGTTATGLPINGTGSGIDFGAQTAGTYIVVGTNVTTGCVNNMTGSDVITTAPLPTVYTMTGGGNYCPGGTGAHVGLSGSNIGVTYQLYIGATPTGTALPGTGLILDFGLHTAGAYSVMATSGAGCTNNMTGTVNVVVSALPGNHNVTGGGNYCAGGTGVHVGLNGSDAGINYQLYNGFTAVGTTVAGTGSSIDMGLVTGAGTYSIVANSSSTTCSTNMTGVAVIVVNPLPSSIYTVTGGGNYCIGTTGTHVGLSGSDVGVNYQLYTGTSTTGSLMAGTGVPVDFGLETAAGTYTVIGINALTGCSNTMSGSTNVTIGALPIAYPLGGGGSYCAGGTGVAVTLAGSNTGVTYQLFNGATPSGTSTAGTGSALNFGLTTGAGSYTVIATNNATSCTNNMTGSISVVINPLPVAHGVGSLSSSYCAGGAGVDITLDGSQAGVNYQLFHGATPLGMLPGTGAAVDFGFETITGPYTVIANNPTTGCTANMSGDVVVAINPLPSVYTVTGGGSYCSGGAGVHVNLSGSATGVAYQLFAGSTPTGSAVTGTGGSLDFGSETVAGTYTVIATGIATTCTSSMSGATTVVINSLPNLFPISGGGNYCSGGAGVPVGLSNSNSGINYQLVRGTTAVGSLVPGTGGSVAFGSQTAAGTYSVVGVNSVTGCTNNMIGTVVVSINPLPSVYTITGGGNYCAGSGGVHIGVSGSEVGVTYHLSNGTLTTLFGSGSSLDFGLESASGAYNVLATNAVTGCANNMSGAITVSVNALPTVYSVTGGGAYCASGHGVHIGLNSSAIGTNYQLNNGFTGVSSVAGTGGILDFGLEAAAGTYTVIATNAASCIDNMSGSATVVINANVTPTVLITNPGGDTVCSGNFISFTANTINAGFAPTYQWTINGVNAGSSNTYGYIPSNHDVISVSLTSSAACASPVIVSNTQTITVNPKETPSVSASVNPGNIVCAGSSVTFTASGLYGGAGASYSWIKNNSNAGSGTSLTYIPSNGDVVYCVLTSNYACRLANTASSNEVTMEVDLSVTPSVVVTSSNTGSVTSAEAVTFTATASNAGSSPTYQWYVNNSEQFGATLPIFVKSGLSNNDSVSCQVTSSGGCAGMIGSGSVRIHGANVGVHQVAANANDIQLIPNPNKGIFMVKGTLSTTIDQEVTIEVTDMVGKVVYTNKVTAHNGEINEKIQMSNGIANGMYILSLHTDSENKVFHMVIEQ